MARRGDGEGTIYQRADGRWCARLSLGNKDGSRKRKDFYGKTRREVQQKLKAYLKDQRAGMIILDDRITVEAFLAKWLEDVVRMRNKASTYKSYSDTVRLYLIPHLGHYRLGQLAPEHVQRMLNDLQSDLAARTVAYVRAVLRGALNRALRWGYVMRNVAALAEPPRQEKKQITPLTQEQAQQLLAAVADHRLAALYTLALGIGLRRGELLGLHWSDVDLVQGSVTVREGKTRSSNRTLPLSPALVTVLQQHWERQQQERSTLANWKEHGLVFPSEVGTPIPGRNLVRHFKGVLEKADLPDIRFHDLRHTCATFMISNGTHARVVMEVLGHSQISITMNTYAHVVSEAQKEAIQGLDRLFRSST